MNKRHILLLKIDKGGEHWLCADGTIDYIVKPIVIPGRKRFYDYIGNSGTEDGYLDYRGDSPTSFEEAESNASYYSLDTTGTVLKIGTHLYSVLGPSDPEGNRYPTYYWEGRRSYIRFNTSGISSDAVINSVTLNLTVSYKYNCYDLKVYKKTWYPLDSEDWARGTLVGSIAASNIPDAENSFNIALDTSSVTKAGYTELQLASAEDSYVSGTKRLEVYSANDASGKPQLTVNYTLNTYEATGYLKNSAGVTNLGSGYLKGNGDITYNVPTSTSYVRGSLSIPTPEGTAFLNSRVAISGRPAVYRFRLVNGEWNIQQIDAEPPIIIQRASDKPSVLKFYTTAQIDDGDKLLVTDGVYTWSGVVIKITRDLAEYSIEAADYLHYLQNINISKTYLHQTDIEIIQDILSNAVAAGTPNFEVITSVSPRLIGQIRLNGNGLMCIGEVAQKVGRHFYLIHDGPNTQPKLYYVDEDNGSYPLTVQKGTNLLNGWSVERVTPPVKNHIFCHSRVADLPAKEDIWTNSVYPYIVGPLIPITDDDTTYQDIEVNSGTGFYDDKKIYIDFVPTMAFSHWIRLKFRAKKVGNPTQPLVFKIYNADTYALLNQYVVPASSIGTDYQDFEFEFDLIVSNPDRNFQLQVDTTNEPNYNDNYYLIQGIKYKKKEPIIWHFFNMTTAATKVGNSVLSLIDSQGVTVPLILLGFSEKNSYGWILEGGALNCSNHQQVAKNRTAMQFYFPDENASARLDLPVAISPDDYQRIVMQAVFPWGIEVRLCEDDDNYLYWRMTSRSVPFEFYKLTLNFNNYAYKKVGNPDLGNLKFLKIAGVKSVIIDELVFEGKSLNKHYVDDDSIQKFGKRKETVEISDLFYTLDDIDNYCQDMLNRLKDPQTSYLNFQVSGLYDIPLYSSVNIDVDGTPVSIRVISLDLDLTRRTTSFECGKYPIRLANILKKIKE